jgi:hypothetical protein
MKNSIIALAATLLLLASCESEDKKEANQQTEASINGSFAINRDASRIYWKGSEDNGKEFHEGEIKLHSGKLRVSSGKIENGELVCDLESISIYDLEHKQDRHEKLKGHFLDPDFFAADDGTIENPLITVLSVTENEAKLRVTVRGISIDVTAPITVQIAAKQVVVDAESFNVNFLPFSMPFFQKLDSEVSIGAHLVFDVQ